MMANLPPALKAADLEKDVQMTSRGIGSVPLPAGEGPADLGQMIDSMMKSLERMKEVAMAAELESREQVMALKEENRLLRQKLTQREREIIDLEQTAASHPESGASSSVTASGSGEGSVEFWKTKYEELERRYRDLERRLNTQNAARSPSLQRSASHPPPTGHSSQNCSEEDLPFNEEHRNYLCDKMEVTMCKKLMRKLNVPERHISNIFYNPQPDPTEHCIACIKHWQDENGRKATVWGMVQALLNCGQRAAAEDFCEKFAFCTLLKKIDDFHDGARSHNDSSSSLSSLGRDSTGGVDSFDLGPTSPPGVVTPPDSPQVCPPNAPPLHRLLWCHLLDPDSAEELNNDLGETVRWSPEQCQKFAKRMQLKSAEQQERFSQLLTGEGSDAIEILEAWADVELSRLQDQSEVPRHVLRSLGKMLRKVQAMDVRSVLLRFLHSGVLGPHLDEITMLRDKSLSFNAFQTIARQFSEKQKGKPDWKNFASKVGFSQYISQWETQAAQQLPGESVLIAWKTGKDATIGKLYDWAVEVDRTDITKILEDDLSKH